jgi:hypothetical protein
MSLNGREAGVNDKLSDFFFARMIMQQELTATIVSVVTVFSAIRGNSKTSA